MNIGLGHSFWFPLHFFFRIKFSNSGILVISPILKMPERENDMNLLEQISLGNEKAFNELYEQYAPTIFNTVMLYSKQENLAREIVQIVFIRVWEKRSSLPQIQRIEDYLFIMARNLLFNHFKKTMREGKLMLVLSSIQKNTVADTSHRTEQRIYDELLDEAISKLPPQQRQVYIYSKKTGLSYDEIASKMNLSRNTIRKHLELANRFVRNYINGHLNSCVMAPLVLFSIGMFR